MNFETIEDEHTPGSLEHWDSDRVNEELRGQMVLEAFVHPDSGTAARIMEHEDSFSVQPVMGDFGPYDEVIQPEDPTGLTSGWSSVAAMNLESLADARAVAYGWITGWIHGRNNTGDKPGDVRID